MNSFLNFIFELKMMQEGKKKNNSFEVPLFFLLVNVSSFNTQETESPYFISIPVIFCFFLRTRDLAALSSDNKGNEVLSISPAPQTQQWSPCRIDELIAN